jgi:hypothetical protein
MHGTKHHAAKAHHQAGHDKHAAHGGGHKHGKLDVVGHDVLPTVDIEVMKDAGGGYNVHIKTSNFKFTPARIDQPNVVGEGHAHLYVNGKKINRVYGHWYHLGKLAPGRHEVKVTLNANQHDTYYHDGKEVADSVTVQVE